VANALETEFRELESRAKHLLEIVVQVLELPAEVLECIGNRREHFREADVDVRAVPVVNVRAVPVVNMRTMTMVDVPPLPALQFALRVDLGILLRTNSDCVRRHGIVDIDDGLGSYIHVFR